MSSDFRRFGNPAAVLPGEGVATITVKLKLSLLSHGSVTMQVAVIAVQRPDKNGLDKPLRSGQ
jgi:hypothetical protein